MKFSGHMTLEIIDEITGEVINTIEKDNIITNLLYENISILQNKNWPQPLNIFISTETATPVRSKTSIQSIGIGYTGAGQPPTQVFQNANPPYFVITKRYDAVTTARTFQTVGVTNTGGDQLTQSTAVIPFAYLLLNQPCTQEVNQVLNIVYRITIEDAVSSNNLAKSFFPKWINNVCNNLITSEGVNYYNYLYSSASNTPLKEYGWRSLYVSPAVIDLIWQNNRRGEEANPADRALFYRHRNYWFYSRTNNEYGNGKVFNGLYNNPNKDSSGASGNRPQADPGLTNSAQSAFQALGYNQTVNLQSAFSYSAAPPVDVGPMFLPDNNPSGTGVVQFSEDPWTGTWPTIYRIKITQNGQVGTAKFVLGVKHFTSFRSDGTYTYSGCYGTIHPYITHLIQPYDKCHGWQVCMPILAIDTVWTVQGDKTGISIVNQFTGQHFDFDSTTTPSLPITNIRQIAIDKPNNLVYVACSSTGLWRLNVSNKAAITVTNLSSIPTYAVDVDATGVIYAFMNLATTTLTLTSSASNYANNLGFNGAALTTANRLFISINKIHPDTRMYVQVRSGQIDDNLSRADIYWWSLASGNQGSILGASMDLRWTGESQNTLAWVRNSDSRVWTALGSLLVYGLSQTGAIFNGVKTVPPSVQGIDQNLPYDPESRRLLSGNLIPNSSYVPPSVGQDNWGNLIPENSQPVYNPFNSNDIGSYSSYSNVYQRVRQVDMGNGIFLSNIATFHLNQNAMDNSIKDWIWYKWDGTNWVKSVNYNQTTGVFTDTTGTDTKTTATSFTPLLNNINIKFTNGVSGTSFIVGEVYDQYVCKGVLKTNDNSVYIEHNNFYSQPLFENITLTPTVITAPNNHAVVVDGAPGNTGLSAAVSAIIVNPLWHALLPDPFVNTMQFFVNGVVATAHYCEGRDTLPTQASLTTGQLISYRNGLVLCSAADVGKTLTGYFSYVARSS